MIFTLLLRGELHVVAIEKTQLAIKTGRERNLKILKRKQLEGLEVIPRISLAKAIGITEIRNPFSLLSEIAIPSCILLGKDLLFRNPQDLKEPVCATTSKFDSPASHAGNLHDRIRDTQQYPDMCPEPGIPSLPTIGTLVVCDRLEAVNIQKDAEIQGKVGKGLFAELCPLQHDSRRSKRIVNIGLSVDYLIFIRIVVSHYFYEAIMIKGRQANVNIIVPRNKTLMTQSTNARPSEAKETKIILVTDINEICKYLQLTLLQVAKRLLVVSLHTNPIR